MDLYKQHFNRFYNTFGYEAPSSLNISQYEPKQVDSYENHKERYYKTFKRHAPSSIEELESEYTNSQIQQKYKKARLAFKVKVEKKISKEYIIQELTLLIKELSIDKLICTYDVYDLQTLFVHRNLIDKNLIDESMIISCLKTCGFNIRKDYRIY
jgi:hypothetical protein